MTRLHMVLGAAALLAGGVAGDILLNDGRLLTLAAGRAGVEEACRPELARTLVQRGFSPSGITFAGRPPLGFNYSAGQTFASAFTFEDGPQSTRVDGVMACAIERGEVRVEVRTAAPPIRAS